MTTMSLSQAAVSAVALFSAYVFYRLYLLPKFLSPLRHLRGPDSVSLITGNLTQFMQGDVADNHLGWIDSYGPIVRLHSLYGDSRLYITDKNALAHIYLAHSYAYPKPDIVRGSLGKFLGNGLLLAEGEAHKRQRRIMNLPFTQASVNGYLPVFQLYADKLVEKLSQIIASERGSTPSKNGWQVVEMMSWLSRTTLDIIGQVGFDYDMHALEGEESEITGLTNMIFAPKKASGLAMVVGSLIVVGSRSCIGYRFALLEIKALLATLVDNFQFSPRDEDIRIRKHIALVARPFVVGEVDNGCQLPLRIRVADRE